MDFNSEIQAAKDDPQKLEQLYRAAQRSGQSEVFQSTLLDLYRENSDNLCMLPGIIE